MTPAAKIMLLSCHEPQAKTPLERMGNALFSHRKKIYIDRAATTWQRQSQKKEACYCILYMYIYIYIGVSYI